MPWPEFDVVPLRSAGPFVFRTSRADVRAVGAALGAGSPVAFERGKEKWEHFSDATVQFLYDAADRLIAIQFSTEVPSTVTLGGQDLRTTPVRAVLPSLASSGQLWECENKCSYVSFALGLSLWRASRLQRGFTTILCAEQSYMESFKKFLPLCREWLQA